MPKKTASTETWIVDTTERAVCTFLEAFAGAIGIQGLVAAAGGDWSTVRGLAGSAAAAGASAAFTVIKAAIAKRRKGTVSPASLIKTTATS